MTETHEESGAFDSPMRTVPIPWSVPREPVGLGQLIKGATSRVGLQPCASCERRAQRLDRWVRFGSVGSTLGSGRRSVVVVGVTVAAAVGGAVAGGKLGRRAGSAAGTRLREKMQHRVTRPERLDSVVGYAEQGGKALGSIVGGTVAALAALSLADRFLGLDGADVLGRRQLLIGDPVELGTIPHEVRLHTGTNWDCQVNYFRCRALEDDKYLEKITQCSNQWRNPYWRDLCMDKETRLYKLNLGGCEFDNCTSECCGSGRNAQCVDLKTDPGNCGTCGHGCGPAGVCTNGACQCPQGSRYCAGPGGTSTCCDSTWQCCAGAPTALCCPPGKACGLTPSNPTVHCVTPLTTP
jgi:hypothetical protein